MDQTKNTLTVDDNSTNLKVNNSANSAKGYNYTEYTSGLSSDKSLKVLRENKEVEAGK